MALTNKMLQAMEIPEEKIEQIIAAHRETINGLTAERDTLKADVDRYKAEAERLANVEKELVKAEKQLEDAKDASEKLKSVQEEFSKYKTNVETKARADAVEKAFRGLLKEAGVAEKYFDKIVKVSDLSAVKLDKDNNIQDSNNVVENIKSEWSDFVVTQGTQGAKVPNPPGNTGGSRFESMSLAEKMNYANENPNNAEVQAWLK